MKRLDLIIDALDGITNGNYNPRLAKEALAVARELREMESVGIVQRTSIVGYPMADSTGVEWLRQVNSGDKLYALGDEK